MKPILLIICLALPFTSLDAQEQYMKSVVRITAQIEGIGEETGAGIIVGKEGANYYIATARHVVNGSDDIVVQVHGDKTKYKAKLMHQDSAMDAAVLVFTPEKPPILRELIHADADIIIQGRKVQSIGHPGGSYWLSNLLNLVQQTSLYEDEQFFSITPQAVIGGCSGGPVFTETGAWLGMITETSAVQAKCLKAEILDKWLRAKKVPANFIYAPTPEMVRIEGKKPRADSFAIHIFHHDTYNYLLSYAELKIPEVNTFSLGKYEVTMREFEAFVIASDYTSSNMSTIIKKQFPVINMMNRYYEEKGIWDWRYDELGRIRPREEYNRPVIHVSWIDADAYCKWLSKKTGIKYRLPSFDEWVYAFFPSKTKAFQHTDVFGNIQDSVYYSIFPQGAWPISPDDYKYFYVDGFAGIAPVGSFTSNEWGLHDMYGNVSEWCNSTDRDKEKDGRHWCLGPNWNYWRRTNNKWGIEICVTHESHYFGNAIIYLGNPKWAMDTADCSLGFRLASD